MLLLNELNILDAAGVQREGRNLLARVSDELKIEPLNEKRVAGRGLQWILRVILEFVFVSQEQLAVLQHDPVSRLHFVAAIVACVFRQLRRGWRNQLDCFQSHWLVRAALHPQRRRLTLRLKSERELQRRPDRSKLACVYRPKADGCIGNVRQQLPVLHGEFPDDAVDLIPIRARLVIENLLRQLDELRVGSARSFGFGLELIGKVDVGNSSSQIARVHRAEVALHNHREALIREPHCHCAIPNKRAPVLDDRQSPVLANHKTESVINLLAAVQRPSS